MMAIYSASSSNYVNFGQPSQLQFAGDFSVCAWAYAASYTGAKDIIGRYSSSKYCFVWETTAAAKLALYIGGGSTSWSCVSGLLTANALSANQWIHLCSTYKQSTRQGTWYVDGVQSNQTGTASALSMGNGESWLTHRGNFTTLYPWTGTLFDLRIYGSLLSAAEVMTIAKSGGKDNILSGLVLRTAIQNGVAEASLSGATIRDYSSYKNDVTATGAPTAKADPFGTVRSPQG